MEVIVFLLVSFFIIILFRLIGAWMLRINEVINRLEDIIKLLKDKKTN